MTANQTIDGVLISRQLAERLTEGWNGTDARIELRALLDAEQPAQPQGKPVAWMFKYLSHSDSPPYSSFEVTDFHQNPKAPGIARHTPLYAEQPAPVAVARPTHANPPPGAEPSGTHHDNDGLDEMRNTK